MECTSPKIVVVGSLNVDHTLRVSRIPCPGETLVAREIRTCLGGKGANQAVAAARAGGSVRMIGCVGRDDDGDRYLEALRAEGINTNGTVRSETPTGSAFIAVDDAGENTIIVHPGANLDLSLADIDRQAEQLRAADALLLQLECPLSVVRYAAALARKAGVKVLLNPSPLDSAFLADPFEVDVLIANEGEAGLIAPNRTLREARCHQLLITRGARSTLCITAEGVAEFVPPRVIPVDTVGAGDTFAGAFAVSNSVSFANAAGALATLKSGAQPAIPVRGEILSLLGETV